jgi:ribulose-phosphate 3-epimerase
MKKIKISPSILCANFGCLDKEIRRIEIAKADMVHIDVMDGHFVPNITIGPVVVKYIRRLTRLPLDVHLMIDEPEKFIDEFVKAGSDMITVHIEAISSSKLKAQSIKLRKKGIKIGVSLNPNTPLSRIQSILGYVDLVLIMSVFPGFSGQEFIPSVLPKIKKLRSIFSGDISVDGGINDKVAAKLINAGANILAAGSYVFGSKDAKLAIERIRNAR